MAALNGTENEKAFISMELYEKLSAVSGKLSKGDVLVTGGGSVGNPYIVPNDEPLYTKDADLLWIKNNGSMDPMFVYEFFLSPTFRSYLGSVSHVGTIAHYTITQLSETPISLPSIEEQRKIGETFKLIDSVITLHQCKHYLPITGDLRGEFDPFRLQDTATWEQRKLGDVADVTKLAGFEFTEHVVYSDTGNIIALRGLNVKNGQLVLDDVKYIDGSNLSKLSRSKLYANDIMFTYVGTVGEVAIINDNDRFYLAPNVSRIRVQSNDSPRFVSHYMRSEMFYRTIILPLIATSSQPALSMENIRKFVIDFPKKIDEQIKIAAFFDQIDNLITLHQCKHYRRQTGAPYVKSNSFQLQNTATWEQRKLSDVADIIGGGTPSTDVPEYWDGDIDWYAPAEINDQIYVDHSERKITQLGLDKSSAKILPANKTVLFTSRAGIGKTAILQHDAATNQGFQSLVLNDDTNPYFIFTMTEMIKVKAEKVASGSTFAEISGKMLGKLEFMFPKYEEQVKIGDCFKHIDDIITLHQCKHYHSQTSDFYCKSEPFLLHNTATWEQRKFSDLFKERREKTTVEDEDVLLSCAITGIYLNSELFGHQRGRSNIGYLKIKMNDLILSAQNLHLGNANVNKRFEHGIISPAYKVFEIVDCNPDFIQAWVKQETTKKFFLDVTTEGASQCRKNIDWNLLANSTIPVPSEREQSVLGDFLFTLDKAITLHQRNNLQHFYNHFWFI